MRKKVLVSRVTVLLLSFILIFSCQNIVEAKAKVKISNSKITLCKGQSKTLKVKGTKKKPKWSSSKKSVASVSKKGKITAKKKGTATITAKIGKKKYKCKVTVESPSLNKKSLTLAVGKTYNLKLNGTKQKVVWKSKNSSVAAINSKGKVTAKKAGSTYVYAKVLGKSFSCKVTVQSKLAENYTKLKNYINRCGDTNENGDKFISWYDLENDQTFGIVYESRKDTYNFISITGTDDIEMSCSVYINRIKSNTASPQMAIVLKNYDIGCVADTTLNIATFSKNTNLHFNISYNDTGLDESEFQELTNANLQLSFAGWQMLLVKYPRLTMSDLGFTSYR